MIGETMFVTGIAMFLTAPIAGRLMSKVDPRLMMITGFLGFAAGTWMASAITKDWFNDEHIVMGTVAMVIGGMIFFYRVFRVDFPVVDLRAFANRNFAFGSLFSFVMGVGLYGLTYL